MMFGKWSKSTIRNPGSLKCNLGINDFIHFKLIISNIIKVKQLLNTT